MGIDFVVVVCCDFFFSVSKRMLNISKFIHSMNLDSSITLNLHTHISSDEGTMNYACNISQLLTVFTGACISTLIANGL